MSGDEPTVLRVPVPISERYAPAPETNAYLVGTEDALLVDPADRTDDLDRAVRERGVDAIAVTHAHPDHVGAVAEYAERTGATVFARAGRTDAFREATGIEPDETVREGTTLPAGGTTVRVLETPGHAPDHVAFEADGWALAGDLAIAEGSVAVAAPSGDVRAYVTSLRRMYARAHSRLYPGHGPVIDEPRPVLEGLIDRRRSRERTVLAAVREGARTPAEVVEEAYEKDVSDVFELARRTVIAHLEKLDAEGKVRWDGERAEPA